GGGVEGQGPGGAGGRVLHGDAAAVGGGGVVGDDHVGQGQAGVALVADAAAAAGGAVAGGREAVLDGEALHGHGEGGGGGAAGGGDVGDAGEAGAVDGGEAAAGVDDHQGTAAREDVAGARGVGILVWPPGGASGEAGLRQVDW